MARATGDCECLSRSEIAGTSGFGGIEPLGSKVAALMARAAANGLDAADDLARENLLDTHAASSRFGFPRHREVVPGGRPRHEGRRPLDGARAAAATAQWA
jgi:hypothetical protein